MLAPINEGDLRSLSVTSKSHQPPLLARADTPIRDRRVLLDSSCALRLGGLRLLAIVRQLGAVHLLVKPRSVCWRSVRREPVSGAACSAAAHLTSLDKSASKSEVTKNRLQKTLKQLKTLARQMTAGR